MADNVTLPGTGNVVSTEDVGSGVEVQRIKVITGALHTDGGDVTSTNRFPIDASPLPLAVQKTSNISSGSVGTLAKAFASAVALSNSIVVVCGVGNGTTPTVADQLGNAYALSVVKANGSAFNVAIFYAPITVAGTPTVTVTNGGTTASIAMEIYEFPGLLALAAAQPGKVASASGTSATATAPALLPAAPNSIVIAGVGLGTANQTITPATGWTNDSGQLTPITPAGLFSLVAMSQFSSDLDALTASATFTSEPWAVVVATFRPVMVSVSGSVVALPSVNKARLSRLAINVATSGDQTIIAAVTGQVIRVYMYFFQANGGDLTLILKDGASTTMVPAMLFYQGGGDNKPLVGEPYYELTSGNAFIINLSASLQLSGSVWYTQS